MNISFSPLSAIHGIFVSFLPFKNKPQIQTKDQIEQIVPVVHMPEQAPTNIIDKDIIKRFDTLDISSNVLNMPKYDFGPSDDSKPRAVNFKNFVI